jgi:hypothetical protein
MRKLIAAAILSGIMLSVIPSAAVADIEGPREEPRPWYVQADREGPREEIMPKTFAATNSDPEGPREERLLPIAG